MKHRDIVPSKSNSNSDKLRTVRKQKYTSTVKGKEGEKGNTRFARANKLGLGFEKGGEERKRD
ncbi:hypothetical protein KFK09_019129 [Dendrobium nobile]|uniref:Uncharacterized protein n=1 Tax=Dendrobium nobile TaxID=94219 RepID=A0A8T3AXU7_DENNO|nr:hypothetical protein KFK09_019129 [Dendrobium nobile]